MKAAFNKMSKIDMSLDDIISLNKADYRRPRKKLSSGKPLRFQPRALRRRKSQTAFRWRNKIYSNHSLEHNMLIYQNQNRFQSHIDEALEKRPLAACWPPVVTQEIAPGPLYEVDVGEDGAAGVYVDDAPPQTRLQVLLTRQKRAASYLHQLRTEISRIQSTRQARSTGFMNTTLYSDTLCPDLPPITVTDMDNVATYQPINDIDTEEPRLTEPIDGHVLLQTIKPKQKKPSILKISIQNHAVPPAPAEQSLITNAKKKKTKKQINFAILSMDDVPIKQATEHSVKRTFVLVARPIDD